MTGASGAIGMAIARGIAAEPGWEVVLVCRDRGRGERCAERIAKDTGNPRVRCEPADLSRQRTIRALEEGWKGPLHLLVNYAAVAPRHLTHTPEGIELQFATNVLGYFWMTEAFIPRLGQHPGGRVVNVASYWAGGLDFGDLEFGKRRYDNGVAYRQSKQADRMLTVAFADRFESLGIRVNACHPGDVNSTLSNQLGFGGHQTPEEGADTPVWLALGEAGGRHTGGYFEHRRPIACPFARDRQNIEALYAACQSYNSE